MAKEKDLDQLSPIEMRAMLKAIRFELEAKYTETKGVDQRDIKLEAIGNEFIDDTYPTTKTLIN